MDATRHDAFFLDLDGTLIETTPTPDEARATPRVRDVLFRLARATDGATMIVSGRAIAKVDELLGLRLPVAGQHGAEMRFLNPAFDDIRIGISGYDRLLARCAGIARTCGDARVEAKNPTIALHLSRADPAFDRLLQKVGRLAAASHGRLACIVAHNVVELRPADIHKGMAVAGAAMFGPFGGRRPIFAGNDTPDIDGFRAAEARGGFGIAVGTPQPGARHLLASPDALLDALDAVAGSA
ncbi:MAG: trehalose-phosphatase [Rhodospirillales bacterium]|nr:trehalose-phosphatase [Rhodospirillales bacterium]